ncbi:MAG TPA: VanW family protein [Aggregatilineales bacterium]|nr:VanW family protein [Aggregatilineales bacterium]
MSQQPPSYYVNPHPGYEPEDAVSPWVMRFILLGSTGIFLLIFSMVTLLAGYQFMTQDQIYPGISPVYGVDLAGMTQQEALIALSEQSSYGDEALFTFTYAGQEWQLSGEELGINFDRQATVDNAYNVGRDGNGLENLLKQWEIWRDGYALSPIITFNRTKAQQELSTLADSYINQAVIEASLTIQDGQVVTTGSQVGLQVDLAATMARLEGEIMSMNTRSTIPLVVNESEPALADASLAAEKVRIALDERGVTFLIRAEDGADAGPWVAKAPSIENMLRIERVDNEDGSAYFDVYVELDQARDFLTGLSEELNRNAQASRFIFNDETRQLEVIESSVNGRQLDIETTLAQFPVAVFAEDHRTVPLVLSEVVPTVNNNATAAELGITGLVTEATTYYIGSTAERRANIQVAAARFHGIVIPPYGEFSFNEWLGEVAPETGFEQALIIVGGQTIEGVGGGVCQVSTTAFQAAFYAGFPILERYPHGYRVGYYETGEGPGMDSTVFSPVVDFRFKNDTPYHLLIETYVRPASSQVTFRFYSTSMNRRVVKEGPIIKNVQAAPPPIYRPSADLAPGEVIQRDYEVAGAEVFVYRTVYQDDEVVIDREEFYSNYIPWPAQFEVAPDDSRLTQNR